MSKRMLRDKRPELLRLPSGHIHSLTHALTHTHTHTHIVRHTDSTRRHAINVAYFQAGVGSALAVQIFIEHFNSFVVANKF